MTQYEIQMLYSQCQREAIAEGALEPRGFLEQIYRNLGIYNGGPYWEDHPVARERLARWTQEKVQQRLQAVGL
jgi:hypothetical protein